MSEKTGRVGLVWNIGEGEEQKTIEKFSPNTYYEESEKLMHCLNQKSRSGQMCIDFAVNFINDMRETRKELPENTRLVCSSLTDKSRKEFNCLLTDFEQFILYASQLSFESESLGKEEEPEDIDTSWLEDSEEDEIDSEIEIESETESEIESES